MKVLGFEIGFYQIVWLSQKTIFSVLYMYLNALRIKRISITTSFFPKSISHAWFDEGNKKQLFLCIHNFLRRTEVLLWEIILKMQQFMHVKIVTKKISYLRYFLSMFVNRLLARERTQKKSFYQTSTFLQLLRWKKAC